MSKTTVRSVEELEKVVLRQQEDIEVLKAQVTVLTKVVASFIPHTDTEGTTSTDRLTTFLQDRPERVADIRKVMNINAKSFTPNLSSKPSHSSPIGTAGSSGSRSQQQSSSPQRCEFGSNCRKEHCLSLHKVDCEGWCAHCRLHCVHMVPSESNGMCYYYQQCAQCGLNNAPFINHAVEESPIDQNIQINLVSTRSRPKVASTINAFNDSAPISSMPTMSSISASQYPYSLSHP